jgi:hypothetical protein
MASSYDNDLRLNEMGTGDASGTWGTATNVNLNLIADAFGYGTEAITTNADTHSTTIADGSADAGRSLYLKYTGTLDSTCTVSLLPNTVNKLWIIENATSGSQSLSIKQGSGNEVTIPNGHVKMVYTDGGSSSAAVTDALVDLNLGGALTVAGALTAGGILKTDDTTEATSTTDGSLQTDGGLSVAKDAVFGDDVKLLSDAAVLNFGAGNDVTLTHVHDTGLRLNSTMQLQFNDASQNITAPNTTTLDINATDEIELNATDVDINADVDVSGTLTVAGTATLNGHVELGSGATDNITFNGDVVGHVTPNATDTYYLGSSSLYWARLYADNVYTSDRVYFGTDANVGAGASISVLSGGGEHGMAMRNDDSNSHYFISLRDNSDGSNMGGLYYNGSGTVEVTSLSDYRLKENVSSLTGSIDKVKALNPINFNLKRKSGKMQHGFLAHEVQNVVPHAVSGEKDAVDDEGAVDPQVMNASALIPVLTGALKEALAKIEVLENKVAALEAK